jgi:hypothetical protein
MIAEEPTQSGYYVGPRQESSIPRDSLGPGRWRKKAMPIEFKEGNSGYTLGVEEELSIVDATTGELVPKIEEIMSRLPEPLSESVS